jgi:hypothetical protein
MPSAIHEHFTQAVADEIQKELAGLADRFSSYMSDLLVWLKDLGEPDLVTQHCRTLTPGEYH